MNMQYEMETNNGFHITKRNNGLWKKSKDEEYVEYRRKWDENPKMGIVEAGPIHIDIETSTICNLWCPMCFCTVERKKGSKAAYKGGGLMTLNLYKKIIDEATGIGVCSVKLNWRGEPLMNPNIIEMVNYAKQKGIIEVLINTNAVLLDEKKSEQLILAGVDKLIFSVDSVSKENYERIRVGANFEDTMNNIKRFNELNNKNGHPVSTRVQRVLLNETEGEQEKFEDYFKDIVDEIAVEDYFDYDDNKLGKVTEKDYKHEFKCPQIWQRIMITWNGKCYMCCMDGNEEYQIGDVNKESIYDIWHGEKLNAVRKMHEEGKWHMISKCRECGIAQL